MFAFPAALLLLRPNFLFWDDKGLFYCILCRFPVPAEEKHPHRITLPLSFFNLRSVQLVNILVHILSCKKQTSVYFWEIEISQHKAVRKWEFVLQIKGAIAVMSIYQNIPNVSQILQPKSVNLKQEVCELTCDPLCFGKTESEINQ